MALTTFGAIMGFAAEMAGKKEETYKALAQRAKTLGLKEALESLSEEEAKNHALMLKMRRENVTEMILEPISGLQQEDYEIQPETAEPLSDEDILRVVVRYEERSQLFFQDASSKVPLPEVARTLQKIAQKKRESITRLRVLGQS